MMSKSNVLLYAEDLLRWRQEDKRLEEEIRALQLKRNEVKRKLDAAEVFAERLSPSQADVELQVPPIRRPANEEGEIGPKSSL